MLSERLKKAYQRRDARLIAVCAFGNVRYGRVTRYMESSDPRPPVQWSTSNRGHGYVDNTAHQPMREVGPVVPESYGGSGSFDQPRRGKDDTPCGWYTNPDGESWKDGDGLCWGVVYQLSARDHTPRFVAGYQMGGYGEGPTIDFSRVFEDERDRGGDEYNTGKGCFAALDAARYADEMARCIAEERCQEELEQREDEDEYA